MKPLIIFLALVCVMVSNMEAHVGPDAKKKQKSSYRFDCVPSTAEVDLAINNVRVRLQVGGDLFTDFSDGRYIVPKRDPASGLVEVSSIFAGAIWVGGVLPGVNPSLKIACQDYRTSSGVDYYPGPLSHYDGSTNAQTCLDWDRFFRANGDSIRLHLKNIEFYKSINEPYPASKIPLDVKKWPAIGNPFFRDYYDFDLPNSPQGLAEFWDANFDGLYDPSKGDFPILNMRGCADPVFADESYFWIFNDAGNRHEVTEGTPLRMEFQVQAYAFKTLDEINNMTFYRYKLINRAAEPIDSTFFAMWIDPDLGCSEDDYIGCDVESSMMYVYNADDVDGNNGCDCIVGNSIVPTYCTDVPILGIDFFRGPLSEPRLQADGTYKRADLGMSSFTYYNRGISGPAGTTSPTNPIEYYRLLNGYWRDGTPFTDVGNGYNQGGDVVKYVYNDPPDQTDGWSMCTQNVAFDDRKTLQASGPFRLDPGAINELIMGVVWLPEADYPCPSIEPLLRADQRAQNLFDNCFILELSGPDAPTLYPLGLDQEIIFSLANEVGSNNEGLTYKENDPAITSLGIQDSQYVFEGYRIFQLANNNVRITEENLNDVSKAREVLQCDLKNNVTIAYNWTPIVIQTTGQIIWQPTEKVNGENKGVVHSFNIKNDAFSTNGLENFKDYYYLAIAYAHNNFEDFDIDNPTLGQRTTYLVGRGNVKKYTVAPRRLDNIDFNSFYGDGLEVTRLDGDGVINNAVMISKETRESIVRDGDKLELTWLSGKSPLNAKVYDPVKIKDGSYLLSFEDFDGDPNLSTTKFTVEHIETGEIFTSESTIDVLNEELISQFGFSVFFGQGDEPGTNVFEDLTNGFLGSSVTYDDPNAGRWYNYVQEGSAPNTNFIKTDNSDASDYLLDPFQVYTSQNRSGFYPFLLNAFDTVGNVVDPQTTLFYSPAWFSSGAAQIRRGIDGLSNLNNVDIVFTSNKDLWSQCIVVQSSNYLFENLITDNNRSMDLLQRPSVSKNADPNNDNLPAEKNDGTLGYAYFPGYAVDVETGKRLNIFFGENTYFSPSGLGAAQPNIPTNMLRGDDRMWNPNDNDGPLGDLDKFLAGGLHYIFVTDLAYDGCKMLHDSLVTASTKPLVFSRIIKRNLFKYITWSGFPIMSPGETLLSYKDGLIPHELTINMRVKNSFKKQIYTGDNTGFNQYLISVDGKEGQPEHTNILNTTADSNLLKPDPLFGNETFIAPESDNVVKIKNIPSNSSISIYTMDGKFIRGFKNNEGSYGVINNIDHDSDARFKSEIEWDLNDVNGNTVSTGIYLIHVKSDKGQRVIKWLRTNL